MITTNQKILPKNYYKICFKKMKETKKHKIKKNKRTGKTKLIKQPKLKIFRQKKLNKNY